jgi:two-component system phosphate regulon sensor histidine kinase PhoR
MSHELRTPLNAIIGFTDLLLRELPGPLNPEQRTQLGLVKESGSQLLGLVNGVLDLARIEAGHGAITLGPVDLGAAVRGIVAPMGAIAEEQGVELSCACPDGPMILSDSDKLGQIVRNLVSNAVKFTDAGGSVSVSVSRSVEEAVITVADTGIGIAPEHLPRLTERFYRVDRARSRDRGGTGLGLAIVNHVAQRHEARLFIDSAPGKGSEFRLRFPSGRWREGEAVK